MTLLGGMGTFFGPARGRGRPHLAQPADRLLHRVLAARPRQHPGAPALRLPGRASRARSMRPLAPARAEARRVLDVRDVRKSFDGFQAVGGVSFTVPAGLDQRHHRPQRRGQDHALQPDHRPPPARRGQRGASRGATSPASRRTTSAGSAWAARSSAPTSSRGSPCSRTSRPPSSRHRGRGWNLFTPGGAPLPRRRRRRSSQSVGLLDKARRGRGLPLPRQPEAARAGHRARARAGDPAPRRADRGHVGHRRRASPSGSSSASRASAGSPCSSPSTTWRWSSPSPTASPCSTRAG